MIVTVKMAIILKSNFLFQHLPVKITNSVLNKQKQMIIKFIWNIKKPRLKAKVLYGERKSEGLQVLNLNLMCVLSAFS